EPFGRPAAGGGPGRRERGPRQGAAGRRRSPGAAPVGGADYASGAYGPAGGGVGPAAAKGAREERQDPPAAGRAGPRLGRCGDAFVGGLGDAGEGAAPGPRRAHRHRILHTGRHQPAAGNACSTWNISAAKRPSVPRGTSAGDAGGAPMTQQRDDALPTPAIGWALLEPGQPVTLRAASPLHKGAYQCSVWESSGDRLRITMPMEQGKLILVPVGTAVQVEAETAEGPVEIQARVIDRQGGANRSLLLGPLPEPPGALASRAGAPPARTIAVTSGKGGVGKTALVVNLGVALTALGKRVCAIDVDLGTANIDVILNLTPRWNLAHVIAGEKDIFEVLVEGPGGLVVLPGGAGLQELTAL